MKKILKNILLCCSFLSMLTMTFSCDLNTTPLSSPSNDVPASDSAVYKTRAEMLTQYTGMYQNINNDQEGWILDFLVYTEVHSDNAYAGTTGSELSSLSNNTQNGDNKNIERDWNRYLSNIAVANRIIFNIDGVPDPSLTKSERNQWKSEAKIYRAMMMFDMVRLWGGIPMQLQKLPDITSNNIDEVYPLLYPSRNTVDEVYTQIISDLETALPYAPAVDVNNKFLFTKGVAKALLAKAYAEKPMRDYAKVIEYCEAVKSEGYSLVSNYSDLFSVNDDKTDVKFRNTTESIFEITYPVGSGNWVWVLFGINQVDPSTSYDWAKWVTPSRDLIQAYRDEGDTIRLNEAVLWDEVPWSNYYPSDKYAFMYKTRSSYNSVIKIRLADILLLEAEAYVAQNNLSEAVLIVNEIRERVNLDPLPSSVTSSQENMKLAVLNERRLELSFEGQRWFDLLRNDEAANVMNSIGQRDSYRSEQSPMIDTKLVMPIPETQISINSNLKQNEGY